MAVEDIHKIDLLMGGIHTTVASLDDEDVHQILMVLIVNAPGVGAFLLIDDGVGTAPRMLKLTSSSRMA